MKDKIREVIIPIAQKYGQELVDIVMSSNSRGLLVKITVGSRSGPTVSDLTSITKEFKSTAAMSPDPVYTGDYQLEIGSPGSDRSLKTFNDFCWNEGREVKIITAVEDDRKRVEGTIIKAEKDGVILKNDGAERRILYKDIFKAKLKLKF
ncbi:MAG: hypothetical protein R6V47_03785 [Candidatus Delongbacteria bacterium]